MSAAQARDRLCLLGPLPFRLELDPSSAQSLLAGGRLRDAGLRVKWAPSCVQEITQWIKWPLGLEGDEGARENKENLLAHILYCKIKDWNTQILRVKTGLYSTLLLGLK